MRRAIASETSGNRVLADGKWLRCIGNQIVRPGDRIWTDGKCVYGHVNEGGGDGHVPGMECSGVPLLRYAWQDGAYRSIYLHYSKGGMHDLGPGDAHRRLIQRGNRIMFLDNGLLDAELDAQGNLYTLHGARILYDGDAGGYSTDGASCVKRNGEMFAVYDILPYAQSLIPEATRMAREQTEPCNGDSPGSSTWISFFDCKTLGGRVDEGGRFSVVAHFVVEVTHWEFAYYTEGRDTYAFGNIGRAEVCRRIMFDGEDVDTWFKGCRTDWRTFDASRRGIPRHRESHDAWYAPDGSIRYAVHDGMYMTFAGTGDFLSYPMDGGDYVASIHDRQGTSLLDIKASPLQRVNVCAVGRKKFLVGIDFRLYLWNDGDATEIAKDIDNFRIRKMPDIKKWKRMGGFG